MIHLDTSFLVDLLRERARGGSGPALDLLTSLQDRELWISVFVACELQAGAELATNPEPERVKIAGLCSSLQISFPDERFAPTYGRLLAWLQRRGDTIASMDLLIATSALVDEAPLVTRNTKHFVKVPGLELLSY